MNSVQIQRTIAVVESLPDRINQQITLPTEVAILLQDEVAAIVDEFLRVIDDASE